MDLQAANLETAIFEHLPSLADMRHQFHRMPELAYEEFETAAMIRAQLDRLDLPHVDGVPNAPTSTISVIGDIRKPCIALRADIDALPIQEQSGLPYASTHSGKMHACGHDGHITTLLGTATLLRSCHRELPVCVKLIFQPAEEGGGGADRLVRAGVLDGRIGPQVQAIFGLHGWPGLPLGTVATRADAILAAVDTFTATITGKGCHGAFPHLGFDPIVTACEAVLNLQQVVSRDLDPTEPAVVTVGVLRAGTATNIIPDEARFEGTIRTISSTARAAVRDAISRRVSGIAAAAGCTARIDFFEGYPATINDPAMTDYVARIARKTLGPDRFFVAPRPAMGGEDFAYYLEKIPGCFFFVGVAPAGQPYPPLHSDRYDFTDAAIAVGMRMYLELVRNFAFEQGNVLATDERG